MEFRLHFLKFPCQRCDTATTLLNVEAAACGTLNFYAKCEKCQSFFVFKSSWSTVASFCLDSDIEAEIAGIITNDKLLLPPVKTQEEADDDKFLRDFHIDPSEGDPGDENRPPQV